MSSDGIHDRTATAANSSTASISTDSDPSRAQSAARSVAAATARVLRVLILAGIPTGVLVIGLGSRLAMFALRLTSSPTVIGIQSDDEFTIGRFTLSGTYNLLLLGAAFGMLGAAAYQWVRPWLIGPVWFRYLTLALASGAVVGSMLVHADGIDFVLLDPMWFAVALFVALPAIFAVCIAWAVEYVEAHEGPAGYRRWLLPVVLPLLFPLSLFVVAFAAMIAAAWMSVRQSTDVAAIARKPAVAFVMRGAWLGIAVLGLLALVGDIADLRQIN
jgi:hypothetical protein